ncbi:MULTISPECIES: DUF5713 family protein [Shewanella]|uniref:DUF5713 family protein n=1 Tax=Shewanella algae TaxID=38313 RepID=UPI00118459B9|nr:DUF5713 family protein [Shewanella algae]MBO2643670.1 hypothetical protein [Shewanella algae]MBO2686026.1 hypothetical protein [Shewanella algae]MBO2698799.1 hypothetical protein [Shewanella algae]QGS61823.1 hypothetical protein GMX02_21275 [Shewanella algae]QTE90999.1 hypothetical protein JKK33_00840 [Shewanella algae]
MSVTNPVIQQRQLLAPMYLDGYFPDFLVDKLKGVLLQLCSEIEALKPEDEGALLQLTHAATLAINELQDEFEANGSELETVARDCIADEFYIISRAYGFDSLDIEQAISPRDW